MIDPVDLIKLIHRLTLVSGISIFFLCWYPLVIHIKKYNHERTLDDSSPVVSHSLTESNSSWRSSLPLSLLPANDSSHLINITGFKFLINTECSDSLYIVCVHSAPGHHLNRQVIRKSWGSHIPVYFFVGNTTPEDQIQLDTESREFHDIVQGNFHDSYRNLTLKHTMLFKWVVYQCPHIKYVLKCDDDVFINVAKLNSFIESLSPHKQNLLMCATVRYNDICIRSSRSKRRVSFQEYPEHYYPPYCNGPVVLYSVDIIFKLYQLLQKKQKYFWLDDVFITGIVFSDLNNTHEDFDWLEGSKKSLLHIKDRSDLLGFDPNKNLFVHLIYFRRDLFEEMFIYLTNVIHRRL